MRKKKKKKKKKIKKKKKKKKKKLKKKNIFYKKKNCKHFFNFRNYNINIIYFSFGGHGNPIRSKYCVAFSIGPK